MVPLSIRWWSALLALQLMTACVMAQFNGDWNVLLEDFGGLDLTATGGAIILTGNNAGPQSFTFTGTGSGFDVVPVSFSTGYITKIEFQYLGVTASDMAGMQWRVFTPATSDREYTFYNSFFFGVLGGTSVASVDLTFDDTALQVPYPYTSIPTGTYKSTYGSLPQDILAVRYGSVFQMIVRSFTACPTGSAYLQTAVNGDWTLMSVINDPNSYTGGTGSLQSWAVSFDLEGGGSPTFTYTGVPTVADENNFIAQSTISVTGVTDRVTNVKVQFTNLVHTNMNPVTFVLFNPRGWGQVVLDQVSPSSITFQDLVLDDTQTTPLPDPIPSSPLGPGSYSRQSVVMTYESLLTTLAYQYQHQGDCTACPVGTYGSIFQCEGVTSTCATVTSCTAGSYFCYPACEDCPANTTTAGTGSSVRNDCSKRGTRGCPQ